jgi:hypothetical protein
MESLSLDMPLPTVVGDAMLSDASQEPWVSEAVQLRPNSGRTRYLIDVQRQKCVHCGTGVRVSTLWATAQGRGEEVAWCGHCFNAICEPAPLDDAHRTRHQRVLAAVKQGRVSPVWRAVRPALEDLERRGLL